MKCNVTDFDFIRGAFDLLPKDAQGEIYSATLALAMAAEKSREAQANANRIAAVRWMDTVFNCLEDDDWDEYKERGYDLAFLNALKEQATKYGNRALQAPVGGLSEWENIIFVYAFRKGMGL